MRPLGGRWLLRFGGRLSHHSSSHRTENGDTAVSTAIQQILNHPIFTVLEIYEKHVISQLLHALDTHCKLVKHKISELCYDYTLINQTWKCSSLFIPIPQLELVEIVRHKRFVEEKYFFTHAFSTVRLVITKPIKRTPITQPFTVNVEIYVLSQ